MSPARASARCEEWLAHSPRGALGRRAPTFDLEWHGLNLAQGLFAAIVVLLIVSRLF